ncbi:IPT/TIG domain-containing protein [Actinocrispum wychmicini]|uniref:RCC1 domain-containing protein n=1 Tax=Actinocrispum wychmicini TaxID=1213861 RepID=UPI00140536EF|nr:IPT/TIG domain-containing protein [Actinocrispum wychmicini]
MRSWWRRVATVGVLALVASVPAVSVGVARAVSATPAVSAVTPASGVPTGGTMVTVVGSGFGDVLEVRFGDRPATAVTVASDTTLTAVAPAGTGTVGVTVRTADTVSTGSVNYTYRSGSRYTPMAPVRVLDTRDGTGARRGPVGPQGSIELDLSARVPTTATAVVLNLTGTDVTAPTFVTAWPAAQPRPWASNLNLVPGQIAPNLVTVAVTSGRLALFNDSGTVDLVADLNGYYSVDSPDSFTAMAPVRVLDTRDGTGARRGPLGPQGSIELDLSARVPTTATAVVLNLTGTDVTAPTFVTAWPAGQSRPLASNLNLTTGQIAPNLVTVAVTAGRLRLFNDSGTVDLVADLAGFYDPGSGASFTPMSPRRMLDTRDGTGVPAGPVPGDGVVSLDLSAALAPDATAAALNITATDVAVGTYVTAWPHGADRPLASTLNPAAGQTAPNLTAVATGTGTVVDLYNNLGSVDLIADLAGYFVPDISAGRTSVVPQTTTRTPAADQVLGVTGDPTGQQQTVLAAGTNVPAVGGHLAVPATGNAPNGVLGNVTAVAPQSDGTTVVTTTSAPLDDVYSTYAVTADTDLTDDDVSLVQPAARAATPGTPFKLNLAKTNFSCTGSGGGPTITLAADLTRMHVQFNLDIWQPSIHFLLDLHPVFDLNIGFTGQLTCTLSGGSLLRARIPIAATPPIDLTVKPVITLTASGQVGVNFRWEPSLVLGFDRSPRVNQDVHSFGSTGSVGVTGNASFEVFTGLSAEISLAGGRAGVSGDLGPVFTGQIDTRGCRVVDAALRAQLSAFADVFVKHWTFALAKGTFASTRIADSCRPGLRSWGTNYAGQLGTGVTGGRSTAPVAVTLPDGVIDTSGAVALRSDSTVWTWGSNYQGELGRTPVGDPSPTPAKVFGILGATAVTSGTFTNYALRSDRTVWAWGSDGQGELGHGRSGPRSVTPVRIPGLTDVVAVAADSFRAFALRADGTVWGWGWLPGGLAGVACDYPSSCYYPPTRIPGLSGVTGLATAGLTAYAVKSDGTVWAWGANLYGALGTGNPNESPSTPVRVAGLSNIRQVAAGEYTGFALGADGTVWAWGNNEGGALGTGSWCDECFSATPARVGGLNSVTAIAAGGYGTLGWNASIYNFGLAQRSDGTVWSWGDNDSGQLGNGTYCPDSTHCPQAAARVPSLSRIAKVSAKGPNAYALVTG